MRLCPGLGSYSNCTARSFSEARWAARQSPRPFQTWGRGLGGNAATGGETSCTQRFVLSKPCLLSDYLQGSIF